MKEIKEKTILPQPNESVAIALHQEKIASLCYDRVWSPSAQWRSPRTEVPDSIRFFCGTAPEYALIKNLCIRESSSHDISILLEQLPLVYSKIVLLLLKWRVELDRKAIPELNIDQIKQKVLNELNDEERGKISSYSYDFIKSLASKLLHTPMMQQINEDSLLKLINEKKFEEVHEKMKKVIL